MYYVCHAWKGLRNLLSTYLPMVTYGFTHGLFIRVCTRGLQLFKEKFDYEGYTKILFKGKHIIIKINHF